MTKSTILYVITQVEFHLSCDGGIGREEKNRQERKSESNTEKESPPFLFGENVPFIFKVQRHIMF